MVFNSINLFSGTCVASDARKMKVRWHEEAKKFTSAAVRHQPGAAPEVQLPYVQGVTVEEWIWARATIQGRAHVFVGTVVCICKLRTVLSSILSLLHSAELFIPSQCMCATFCFSVCCLCMYLSYVYLSYLCVSYLCVYVQESRVEMRLRWRVWKR